MRDWHHVESKVPSVVKDLALAFLFDYQSEENKYVLLAQKGALTPWHIDYTNTSVFYHLIAGQKDFL